MGLDQPFSLSYDHIVFGLVLHLRSYSPPSTFHDWELLGCRAGACPFVHDQSRLNAVIDAPQPKDRRQRVGDTLRGGHARRIKFLSDL